MVSKYSKKGFTLIEVMITIMIMAIIFTMGTYVFAQAQKTARDAKRKQDLRLISQALELYYRKNGSYPITVNPTTTSSSNWCAQTENCFDNRSDPGSLISKLVPTFINNLPKEPINKYTQGYIYFYKSKSSEVACANNQGQWYMLMAKLENRKDKETVENSLTYWCDGVTNAVTKLSGASRPYFIISVRKF